MRSSDFRAIARDRLAGNWGNAVLTAFVAAIFGALLVNGGVNFNLELDEEETAQLYYRFGTFLRLYTGFAGTLSLVSFILGGVVRLGYCSYLLKQHDRRPGEICDVKDLFSQFHRFGDAFVLSLLTGLYTFLWTLLFIIPGIIATFRYAMAPFILLENPGMTPSQAIDASKAFMEGRKMDLFVLNLSFIGWSLLCVLTLGIGYLWLNPYMNAAYAAFYRQDMYTQTY